MLKIWMRSIGILGGGQLGRMTIEEARKYLAHIEVLSPDYPSPASDIADEVLVGDLMAYEDVLDFAQRVDVLSYEIEGVNTAALREAERQGRLVVPSAGVLELIQDKARQKEMLDTHGIPTARWTPLELGDGLPEDSGVSGDSAGVGGTALPSTAKTPGGPDWAGALAAAARRLGGFPVVQKSRRGGYDGRGVVVLAGPTDRSPLQGQSFFEERIDFTKELAVVVARSLDGSAVVYPCVEMVFDPRANLCDSVLAPARVEKALHRRAEETALAAIRALDGSSRASPRDSAATTPNAAPGDSAAATAGIFAVEMFLLSNGEILVNEIAPRPHNSGHFSIEACVSSQFDQYLRVLLGLPLGSAELLSPAMMVNLLGEPGQSGVAEYIGMERALAIPGVSVHLYGKREVRPFRKMGHLTALGRSVEEAAERAEAARDFIKVMARV